MPRKSPSESLIHDLAVIDDPRMDRTKEHSLIDILMITVCAMLCGAESFVELEQFGMPSSSFFAACSNYPTAFPAMTLSGESFAFSTPGSSANAFAIGPRDSGGLSAKRLSPSTEKPRAAVTIEPMARKPFIWSALGRARTHCCSARSRSTTKETKSRPSPSCCAF